MCLVNLNSTGIPKLFVDLFISYNVTTCTCTSRLSEFKPLIRKNLEINCLQCIFLFKIHYLLHVKYPGTAGTQHPIDSCFTEMSIPNVWGELILDCIHVWTVFSLWIAFFFCQLSLANYYMTIYLIKAFDKIYIAAPFFCFLFFILLHNSFIPLKLGQLSFRMYKDIVHVLKNISLTCIFKLCIQGFNDICL